MSDYPLGLFRGYGIELEYMIVSSRDFSVLPWSDRILEAQAGSIQSEVELGPMAWSNELVMHVIEIKTNGPAKRLAGLSSLFAEHVRRINSILAPMEARLMPTAAHPFMDPMTQTRLWPHEYNPIYESYNRIFDCRGHGWSNLQSTHINLPFADEVQFGRLHAAIRLVLPLMPALTASSPVLSLKPTGFLDSRMEVYRHNADRVPSLTGAVVPEPVFTYGDYRTRIFETMYRDIAPLDPEGILRHEWLNSRGAIARFDRGAIEIRILDIQENPHADLAAAALICHVIEKLTRQNKAHYKRQMQWDTKELAELFGEVIKDAQNAVVTNDEYLKILGLQGKGPLTAGEVWQGLFESWPKTGDYDSLWERPLGVMLGKGCLASRILSALENDFSRPGMERICLMLCDCLEKGVPFGG